MPREERLLTRPGNWRAGILAFALSIAASEVGLRLLAEPPRDGAPARLLGRPLPPLDLLADLQLEPTRFDDPAPERLQSDGSLTRGDLWGISRQDRRLGHAPRESASSLGGWWQSNALGARSRHEIAPQVPGGVTRILAFGDSYTHGSRVPQHETWPALLGASRRDLEVVNFGVDGYGMAQSLLRWRSQRDAVAHSGLVLVFVPGADLPRDVNVFRPLLGWAAPLSVPRFELGNRCGGRASEGLRLVPPLYASVDAFVAANPREMDPALREHLRCHDAHYRRARYERFPLLSRLYLVRLMAAVVDASQESALRDGLMEPGSEALRVSRAIFETISNEARERDVGFLLAFLPLLHEIDLGRDDASFRERWAAMLAYACPEQASCLDLLDVLAAVPPDHIDEGAGSHYGPRTNREIARGVADALGQSGLIDPLPVVR